MRRTVSIFESLDKIRLIKDSSLAGLKQILQGGPKMHSKSRKMLVIYANLNFIESISVFQLDHNTAYYQCDLQLCTFENHT
jgi:hypothetical protein